MDKLTEKINGGSTDILAENKLKIKELFPEVFCEEKIDFEKLKEILGEYIEDKEERYSFTWKGKSQAIRESQKPSTGTLRSCKEESKNWDTTENLYIEGDNLEVLKLLQKTYHGRIKMIYIDPPYNTGNDFIYPDDYKDNLQNYLELTGQVDEEGKRLGTNSEASGRYHTNWLNMMYPRLRLARNLLSDDGFVSISISDEEYANIKQICNEIFGEENFRNDLLVRRYDKNINTQFIEKGLKNLNIGSEHILIYSKMSDSFINAVFREASEERKQTGYWKGFWNDADRPTMRYDILGHIPENGQWKWKKELAYEAVNNYEIFINEFSSKMSLEEYWEFTGRSKKFIRRRFELEGKNKGVEHWVAPSIGILRSSNWNDMLISESISKYGLDFPSPKNPQIIMELIKMLCCDTEIVLDFFSGSSTTAHAVMQLNAEDEGNRKFIMVQLPELTEEKSEAYNAGYQNICQIGKERIRRAGEKIKEDNKDKEGIEDLDIGFKVFKLDSSNIKKWNPDYDNLELTLDDLVSNYVPGRSEDDILYEVMLKFGIDLTYPIEEYDISGNKVYSIGFGALFACFDDDIKLEIAEGIIKLKKELNPEITRVIFKDNGFKNDSVKKNIELTLKRNNITDVMSV